MKAKETQTKRQKAENKELKKAFALLKDEATRYSKMSLDAIDKYRPDYEYCENVAEALLNGLKAASYLRPVQWLERVLEWLEIDLEIEDNVETMVTTFASEIQLGFNITFDKWVLRWFDDLRRSKEHAVASYGLTTAFLNSNALNLCVTL
ncbi:MAG: hypothetical protein IJM54_01270 [Thermoguttaceae bacterium]|nr:hypothetical protein [Thermoguttaceae bacterium]